MWETVGLKAGVQRLHTTRADCNLLNRITSCWCWVSEQWLVEQSLFRLAPIQSDLVTSHRPAIVQLLDCVRLPSGGAAMNRVGFTGNWPRSLAINSTASRITDILITDVLIADYIYAQLLVCETKLKGPFTLSLQWKPLTLTTVRTETTQPMKTKRGPRHYVAWSCLALTT